MPTQQDIAPASDEAEAVSEMSGEKSERTKHPPTISLAALVAQEDDLGMLGFILTFKSLSEETDCDTYQHRKQRS